MNALRFTVVGCPSPRSSAPSGSPRPGTAVALTRGGPTEPAAWSRLGTQDVHSLAFVGDPQHLLFGHHNGIAETRDGGKTWAPLPVSDDAMGMAAADDGSIVIAGHEVFTAS